MWHGALMVVSRRPTSRSVVGRVRWVSVDTNLYGRGSIRLERIEGLAQQLRELEVTVLIHEYVLLEWAQHAHASYQTLRMAVRPLRGDVDGARMDEFASIDLPKRSAIDFEEHIRRHATRIDNVVVLPSTADGARAGMRAQILLQPPGKRKGGSDKEKGTKTGAADIAAVHDAIRYVEEQSEHDGLAIISADRDIDAAASLLNVDWVERFKDEGAAVEALRGFELTPVEGPALSQLVATLTRHIVGLVNGAGPSPSAQLRNLVDLIADDSPAFDAMLVQAANVTHVVGVSRVKEVREMQGSLGSDDSKYVTAKIDLVVGVAGVVERLPVGLEDLRFWDRVGMVLEVPVAALMNSSGFRDLRAVAPGALREPPRDPWTLEEAKDVLAAELAFSPLFGDESWWHDVLNDAVPDGVPSGFDWYRNEFLDSDDHYEIGLVVESAELRVSIDEDPYELAHHGGGSFATRADADAISDQGRALEGAPAVVAELVRRWFTSQQP
jgi:hypothetical protein